jgi:2-phospho-L-lactate/phosphoenolpyruvate guanylyltransferase
MSLWVILPVKPLNRAKSRLADILSPEQRYDFALAMFQNILRITQQASQITGTLVISRDTKVLALAREAGAKTVQESNRSDLNPALTRATEVVKAWGGDAVLILPADLPFITTDDIENIIEMGTETPSVVLATDRVQDGTNALLVRPAGLIDYNYGEGSFTRHLQAAQRAGANVQYYMSDSVTLDIDTPADLKLYNRWLKLEQHLLPPFLPDNLTA